MRCCCAEPTRALQPRRHSAGAARGADGGQEPGGGDSGSLCARAAHPEHRVGAGDQGIPVPVSVRVCVCVFVCVCVCACVSSTQNI